MSSIFVAIATPILSLPSPQSLLMALDDDFDVDLGWVAEIGAKA
ncbi:hypothetical protein [Fortiea contorta]|nr:hypothetical protein [Fortiea contorta]